MYTCVTCNIEKDYSEYHKNKTKKNGISESCKECARERKAEHYKRDPASYMFFRAKARAERKGREFTIVKEDIIIPEYCPVLNIKMGFNESEDSPSLDRINSSKGYTKDNIRVVSYRANVLMGDGTYEEFKKIMEFKQNDPT
jgi:hypothetical protein